MAFVTVIFSGLGVFSPAFRGSLLQVSSSGGHASSLTFISGDRLFSSIVWGALLRAVADNADSLDCHGSSRGLYIRKDVQTFQGEHVNGNIVSCLVG